MEFVPRPDDRRRTPPRWRRREAPGSTQPGERERLALAAVLVGQPELLVLDEPTRGVDPPRKAQLAQLVRSEAGRRATLVVTHDLVFAGDVADRAIALGTREVAHA